MYNPFERLRSVLKKSVATPDLKKEYRTMMGNNIAELVAQHKESKLSQKEVSDRIVFAEKELLAAEDDDVRSVIHIELAALRQYQQLQTMPKEYKAWKSKEGTEGWKPGDGIKELDDIPEIEDEELRKKYPLPGAPVFKDFPDAQKFSPSEPPVVQREDIPNVQVSARPDEDTANRKKPSIS